MPACHAGDRGFDSRRDRHLKIIYDYIWLSSSVGRARSSKHRRDATAHQSSHSLNKQSEIGAKVFRHILYLWCEIYIWLGSSVGRARSSKHRRDATAHQSSYSLNKQSEIGAKVFRHILYLWCEIYIWLGSSVGRAKD